jgi:hypothetical protein
MASRSSVIREVASLVITMKYNKHPLLIAAFNSTKFFRIAWGRIYNPFTLLEV